MPPPWSRIRIVMPGCGVLECDDDDDGSACDDGLGWVDSGWGEDEEEEGFEAAAAAMVTSIGSRSLRLSIVALKAFLRSSVRMYSRWVGTWARRVEGCPLMMTVGRTPYLSSQISETKDSQWRIVSAGRRAVSITPIEVDGVLSCVFWWLLWLLLLLLQWGWEERCRAMCCSAINLVPILARKCSSRNLVTSPGLMYFLHSRNPRASIGMVSACVCTRSAMTSVNWISSSSVLICRSW